MQSWGSTLWPFELSAVALVAATLSGACSEDWDALDPRLGSSATGAGGSSTSASTGSSSAGPTTAGPGGSSTSSTGSASTTSAGGANASTTTAVGTATTTGSGGSTSSSTSGTGGSPAGGTCDNNVYQVPAKMGVGFVDDFETNKNFPAWFSFADVLVPADFNNLVTQAGGAAGTTMAGHVSGTTVVTPAQNGYGAGFGYSLKNGSMQCAGVAAFDGVSFWAKGTTSVGNALQFQVEVAAEDPVADGGDCLSNCFLYPEKNVTLTASWTEYVVKWGDLTGPVPVNGVILGLEWITPGPAFDVWIDEVALYKTTAPNGAIAMYSP